MVHKTALNYKLPPHMHERIWDFTHPKSEKSHKYRKIYMYIRGSSPLNTDENHDTEYRFRSTLLNPTVHNMKFGRLCPHGGVTVTLLHWKKIRRKWEIWLDLNQHKCFPHKQLFVKKSTTTYILSWDKLTHWSYLYNQLQWNVNSKTGGGFLCTR